MARLGLHAGVYTSGIGLILAGAGGVAVAEHWTASVIGWISIIAGIALFLWGVKINDRHWWAYLLDREGHPPQIPLRDLVRRVALHTEWGLAYQPKHCPIWQDDLKREILHKLAEGKIQAWGIRNLPGQPEDSAPTPIPADFWPKADFYPEHMLVDNESGMMWHKGEPCEVIYTDIQFSAPAVSRVWPALSKRKRKGRVSTFAALAREWFDQQEDARINRNPGVGFHVAFHERARLERLSREASNPPPPAKAAEEHELQVAVKAKAQLMRDRLSTRNHIRSDPRYDSPRDISYLAAMWDAEERGHFYDEYHRSTFMPMGKGAPKTLPGDTIAELQRAVAEYKEMRRQANLAYQRRRDLIDKGRNVVTRFRAERPSEPFETWARRQRDYLDVQPHLGEEYQKWVIGNADRNVSSIADGEFLRELARLAKEWNLE